MQTPSHAALPRIEIWTPRPFATVVRDTPELAACFLGAAAWWSGAITPSSPPDSAALARALSAQLKGIADGGLAQTTVVVGAAETDGVQALVYGDVVFVVVPLKPPTGVEEIALAAAPAWLAARLSQAPPDRRASEPLLRLGESLAAAGSLALAALPPPLRPVHEWLETGEAAPALASFVQDALALDTPWQTRRARLAQAQQVGGATPALASAAALGPLRTGCRSEGEDAGFVFARPRPGAGCEIVWRSLAGAEAPLLVWPRWVLSPEVVAALAELWFIDPAGIWRMPLDGSAPPRLKCAGAYRHLAAAPRSSTLAAARWPAGQTVVIAPTGVREHAVDARGGLVWVAADVLLASDGDQLVLLSTRGEVRPTEIHLACCGSLTARGTNVTAAVTTPCEPALVPLDLATGKLSPALHLPHDPFGIVALPDGSLAYGTVEGIWRWRGAGQSERVGAGLTPGPG